jgi:hypothetical protein
MRAPSGCNEQVHALGVAYHEAGHAVVAWRHGFKIVQIDMAFPAVELRYMFTHWIADGREVLVEPGRRERMVVSVEGQERNTFLPEAEHYAQYLLAGNVALRRRYRHVSIAVAMAYYGDEDYQRARNLALAFNARDDEAASRWLSAQWRQASKLLREPELWAAVEALVPRLMPSTRLAGEEVEEVIAEAVRRGRRPGRGRALPS